MDRFHHWLEFLRDVSFAKLLPWIGGILLTALVVHGIFARFTREDRDISIRRSLWSKLVYWAFWIISIVLAASSWGSIMWQGKMEHQALLIHIMAAGAFTALMVAFAYWWNPSFGRGHIVSPDMEDNTTNGWWVARWSLWLVLLASLGVAGTMLLGMLPLFDTQQMLVSISLHRYFGLLLMIGLILHLYSIVVQVLGWR